MRFKKKPFNRSIIFLGTVMLLLSAVSTPLYSRQVKKVIGWVKRKDDKDFSALIEKHYSRQGYLLSERDGRLSLYDEYTYDNTGRLIQFDHFCGENSGNGTTCYQYEDNKVIIHESVSAWDKKITEEYDTNGKIIKKHTVFVDYLPPGNEKQAMYEEVCTFFYNEIGIKINARCVEYRFLPDKNRKIFLSETSSRTLYTYDPGQRLTGIIEIDSQSGRIHSREIFVYDQTSGFLKTKIVYREHGAGDFTNSLSGYKECFTYDNMGRIVRKEFYGDPQGGNLDYVSCYTYDENNILWQQTTEHYFDHKISYIRKDVYKSGNLIRSKEYDADNNLTETIDFQYIYWEE